MKMAQKTKNPSIRRVFLAELAKGVEPPTCALQVRCSTTELRQH